MNNLKLIKDLFSKSIVDPFDLLLDTETRKEAFDSIMKRKIPGLGKPFQITSKPILDKYWDNVDKEDKSRIDEIFIDIKSNLKKKPDHLEELIKFKNKYPAVPAILNYIGIIYAHILNNNIEYEKILFETIKLFPDYLFAKINLCQFYLDTNQYKKVKEILNDQFEIFMHFPKIRKIYHRSEVLSFYHITGVYFVRIKDIDRALYCFYILSDIDLENAAAKNLGYEILHFKFKELRGKIENKKHRRCY